MMYRLVYSPEGGDRQEFEFDADNPLNLEAEALEAVGGESWEDYAFFLMRIGSGNARARRALLWVMLRRTQPELRFVDVVFRFGEFQIEEAEESGPVGKDEPAESGTGLPSPEPDSAPSPNN